MTNKEIAKEFFNSSLWADFPKDVLARLKWEFEQALNEAEERGQKSQPTFEAGYTRGHLDGRIYGQREMREKAEDVCNSLFSETTYAKCNEAADKIRSLPLEGE